MVEAGGDGDGHLGPQLRAQQPNPSAPSTRDVCHNVSHDLSPDSPVVKPSVETGTTVLGCSMIDLRKTPRNLTLPLDRPDACNDSAHSK
jgi:hypothetical protein